MAFTSLNHYLEHPIALLLHDPGVITGWLLRFLEDRVGDPRIISLVRRWLKAGILDEGELRANETGTPQGGSITPLTQNITSAIRRRSTAGRWRRVIARRRSRYRDGVADGNGVVTDENLFHEKSNDTLALRNVQRLRRRAHARHERRERLG